MSYIERVVKTVISILKRFGYQGEILSYVTRKTCGIWFAWIGFVTLIGTAFADQRCLNPFIFAIGYGLGFYLCYGNRKILFKRLANGKQSPFQEKMSDLAMYVLVLLCSIAGIINWTSRQSMRVIWLSIFLAVGIHFLFFYFVHGTPVIILGGLCILYALVGLINPGIPFPVISVLDGATKIAVGIYLFVFNQGYSNEHAFYRNHFKQAFN